MAAKPGFFQYLAAAFNARPWGMFIPPNWIGLGAAGLLGLQDPGFWVLGAGLELGYLMLLSTNQRFQRTVVGEQLSGERSNADVKQQAALKRLSRHDCERYQTFADRCRSIVDLQSHGAGTEMPGLEAQVQGLDRLAWMFLRLLVARDVIEKVLGDSRDDEKGPLTERLASLERQVKDERLDAELRRSLGGQIEILNQRIERRGEAQRKLAYIDAELARMEQQVELIREQAALSTDPEVLSQRIDEIAATLGSTSQWIRDQQQVFGAMDDLLSEPPSTSAGVRAKESQ